MNEEYDVIVLGTGLTVSCGGRRGDVSGRPLPAPGGEGGSDRRTLARPAPELPAPAPPWGPSPLARGGSGEGEVAAGWDAVI